MSTFLGMNAHDWLTITIVLYSIAGVGKIFLMLGELIFGPPDKEGPQP